MVKRRRLIEAFAGVALGAVAVGAIATGAQGFVPHGKSPYIPVVNAIGVPASSYAPGADTTSALKITSIPVISWHQMDNGCEPAAAQCTNPGYAGTNVTQRQFYDEINWLYIHGYRTVTAAQYVAWAAGQNLRLPAKPVLLTVDDGVANFYAGATPVLEHFGYTMVSMVVSGFAQGAQDKVRQYQGWDATWTQLRNLPGDVWEFGFHAGPDGHTTTSATCAYFYPCQRPGESATAYQARVRADIDAGIAAERRELGDRVNTQLWAVPFNDLAQTGTEPQSGTEPTRWLQDYADRRFAVVFVDGLTSTDNQHYRYEVHGTDSLTFFARQIEWAGVYTKYPSPATGVVRPGGQS
jgi:peptidoglycan/xylan/chitin deacetylase (PgdA/CDA1 family)